VKLIAICDKSKLVRWFTRRVLTDIHVVANINDLYKFDLDIIYVTTPIPTHYFVIKTILEEDLAENIFCEKTLSSSYIESRRLHMLALEKNVITMVGYQRRFAVTFMKAKELLEQGVIGDVISFEAYAYSSDFLFAQKENAKLARGGVLRDLGAHAIDLTLWLLGEMKVMNEEKIMVTNDTATFYVTNEKGIRGYFDVSWIKPGYRMPEIRIKITGTHGIIDVNDDFIKLRTDSNEATWYRPDLKDNVDLLIGAPEFFREDKYFIECVLNKKPAKPDFLEGAKVDLIIDEVTKYASLGRR